MSAEETTTIFKHSVKIPTQYKKAAKFLKNTYEQGTSPKSQIFEDSHLVNNNIYYISIISNITCGICQTLDLKLSITKLGYKKNLPPKSYHTFFSESFTKSDDRKNSNVITYKIFTTFFHSEKIAYSLSLTKFPITNLPLIC